MRTLVTILITLCACADVPASEGEASAVNQSIFSGTFADALWTVVVFLVLLAVLSKVAWKPLLKILKAREERIQQHIEAAETARKKAEKMLNDYRQQGMQIVKEAQEQAQHEGQELAEKTRQEILALRQKAHDDIEQARAAAVEQLWEQAGDIVLSLGNEVLGRRITEQDNERLAREAIAKLRQ